MHHRSVPRFMAQPPLQPAEPFRLVREDGRYLPVEIAIRHALQEDRADGHATGDPNASFRLRKAGFPATDCLIEQACESPVRVISSLGVGFIMELIRVFA